MTRKRSLTLSVLVLCAIVVSPLTPTTAVYDIDNPADSGLTQYIASATISPAGNTEMGENVTVKIELNMTVHDEESIMVGPQSVDWAVSNGEFSPPAGGWPVSDDWKCRLYQTQGLDLKDTNGFKVIANP